MEPLDYRRLIYQNATDKNKSFFDELWTSPKSTHMYYSPWWIITALELVAFYIISFKNPAQWCINTFIFWIWFLNGFLSTATVIVIMLSKNLNSITTDTAKKLYKPGFEKRLEYRITFNNFLHLMLLTAFFARGWNLSAALVVYSLIVDYTTFTIIRERLIELPKRDFQ